MFFHAFLVCIDCKILSLVEEIKNIYLSIYLIKNASLNVSYGSVKNIQVLAKHNQNMHRRHTHILRKKRNAAYKAYNVYGGFFTNLSRTIYHSLSDDVWVMSPWGFS